jgi:hypothetical protein
MIVDEATRKDLPKNELWIVWKIYKWLWF